MRGCGRSGRWAKLLGACGPVLLAAGAATAETSNLWGNGGELWDAAGPLPDFSFAGYERGEKPIPDREPDVSVRDFGAKGDGESDDTAAFLEAIAAAPGKVIGVPPGRYVITGILELNASGTVLQGAGPEQSVLVCPKPLHDIRPNPLDNHTAKTGYSWSGGMVWIAGSSFGKQKIAAIKPGASRGDRQVELVGNAGDLSPGDEVIVAVRDDPEQSLVKYLYAGDPGDIGNWTPGREERQQVCRVVSVDGSRLTLDRPLRWDLRAQFNPELRRYDPRLQQCGVGGLGFEFPDRPYRGHFSEDGFNAIAVVQAVHCWVRDIRITNCDSGIFLTQTRFCTVQDVVVTSDRRPGPAGCTGHHGLDASGADNLITRFDLQTQFVHDLSVHRSVGCVYSDGRGVDLSMDHHRRAPYENLFSNLDLGKGDRAFNSGGSQGIGRHAGAGNTFWNLQSKERLTWPADFGPDRINWVGLNTRERKSDDIAKPASRWVERLRPGAVEPPDLHAAQLARRLDGNPRSPAIPEPASGGEVYEWTNAEGKTVRAAFLGVDGETVTLELEDGRRAEYPLANLAPESQKLARELGE